MGCGASTATPPAIVRRDSTVLRTRDFASELAKPFGPAHRPSAWLNTGGELFGGTGVQLLVKPDRDTQFSGSTQVMYRAFSVHELSRGLSTVGDEAPDPSATDAVLCLRAVDGDAASCCWLVLNHDCSTPLGIAIVEVKAFGKTKPSVGASIYSLVAAGADVPGERVNVELALELASFESKKARATVTSGLKEALGDSYGAERGLRRWAHLIAGEARDGVKWRVALPTEGESVEAGAAKKKGHAGPVYQGSHRALEVQREAAQPTNADAAAGPAVAAAAAGEAPPQPQKRNVLFFEGEQSGAAVIESSHVKHAQCAVRVALGVEPLLFAVVVAVQNIVSDAVSRYKLPMLI